VTIGDDSASGEFVMGNGTGPLFSACATNGSNEVTAGSWDTTAPYVAPTALTLDAYEIRVFKRGTCKTSLLRGRGGPHRVKKERTPPF